MTSLFSNNFELIAKPASSSHVCPIHAGVLQSYKSTHHLHYSHKFQMMRNCVEQHTQLFKQNGTVNGNMFLVKMILYTKNWCFVVGSVCLKRASVKQNLTHLAVQLTFLLCMVTKLTILCKIWTGHLTQIINTTTVV